MGFAAGLPPAADTCACRGPAQGRPRGRDRLLRPRDELPHRGDGARVRRRRTAGARRGHGGQPPICAAARRPSLLPDRSPRHPAELRRPVARDRSRAIAAPARAPRRARGRPLPALPALRAWRSVALFRLSRCFVKPSAIGVGVKVLLVTLYFPPAGGGGVQRPLKFATHLPALGIETHVLAPDDPKWVHEDPELAPPSQAWVHRARFLGPGPRGATGAALAVRRALVPDASVPWNLTAIPAALRIARRERIDVVLTTSPPGSVHFVGAAVNRLLGVPWVADLRDSLVAHPHRRSESGLVRAKERVGEQVARLVAARADAIIAVSEAIAEEARGLSPRGRVATIPNGCDFDDFAGLEYRPGDRFRITHAGSFFGKRDPRPFLQALADSDPAVVARFVGDFRSTDRE